MEGFIHTCIHTYIHTYVDAPGISAAGAWRAPSTRHRRMYTHKHIHIHIHECIYANKYMYIHTYIHRCPKHFCGWCLEGSFNASQEAHAHVASCRHKPAGADRCVFK